MQKNNIGKCLPVPEPLQFRRKRYCERLVDLVLDLGSGKGALNEITYTSATTQCCSIGEPCSTIAFSPLDSANSTGVTNSNHTKSYRLNELVQLRFTHSSNGENHTPI